MARMPEATWLGEHSPRTPMSQYDIFCVHTIVGFAPAHAAHFSNKADGAKLQSRDTKYRSAANLNGNHRVIASENEDRGIAFPAWSGSNVPRLTEEQVEANAEELAWAHKTHGIPLQLCPNSRPGSRGLAYHRQGIDGNFDTFRFPGRVPGGEVWTTSFGKVCPGDNRISQLPAILAAARAIAAAGDEAKTMFVYDNLNWGRSPENHRRRIEAHKRVVRAKGIKRFAIATVEDRTDPEDNNRERIRVIGMKVKKRSSWLSAKSRMGFKIRRRTTKRANVVVPDLGVVPFFVIHMPPRRMAALHAAYAAGIRLRLRATRKPWIVATDANKRFRLDPLGLEKAFGAKGFGKRIDGFWVHPDLAAHCSVAFSEPHRDDHVAAYLTLAA